jgi:excisionase family DNA binding protein
MDFERNSLLSVPQFAQALGIKPSCIRRWILLRKITSVKVGRRLIRIPSSEIARLVKEGTRPALEPRR